MKLREEYKVREMAGEHVVIMQGRYGADMTRIISLNESALYLWNELQGKEFEMEEVARLLTARSPPEAASSIASRPSPQSSPPSPHPAASLAASNERGTKDNPKGDAL